MIERWGHSVFCPICDEDMDLPEVVRTNPERLLIGIEEFEAQHRACDKKLLAQMEREMRETSECRGSQA